MEQSFQIELVPLERNIIKKYWFIIAIILLAIIKQLLISNIPITPYPNQLCDDDMMVEMAKSIRAGKWLGNYTSNTLVKGPVFPIILAIIMNQRELKISFITLPICSN